MNIINRLAHYTELLAEEMGLSADEVEELSKASRLHDVGKVGIPDSILKKDGKLSVEEFEVIKTHTEIGNSILAHNEWLTLAREIALTHHERWDGSGYPNGLAGEGIPLTTRIVSVVDVFDALINARPYKPAWEMSKALAYLEDEKGKSFDAEVVDAFLRICSRGEIKQVSI
ncbi:MAG: HD domain-containing protein [Gammaproteobacteria bacterium]|nr:HD domain-containing protein [Gammaproteobacteria bacterium]